MKQRWYFLSTCISTAVCLVILTACGEEKIPIVNVSERINVADTVGLEEIVSDVHIIDLQCDSLYEISIFGEYDGRLYGRTVDNIMVIFSDTGKLLYKIDRRGRGPGEYVNPIFHFDNYRGEILVLDALNKVLRYDRNGAFIEEISNNIVKTIGDVLPSSADSYIATTLPSFSRDSCIMCLDGDFSVIGYAMPVLNKAQLSRDGVTVMERLWYYNSSIMYQPFGEEEYYRYSEGKWIPYLRVKEGRYRMPVELLTAIGMEDAQAGYIMPYRFCISGKYFLYSYTILDRMAIYFDVFDVFSGKRLLHNIYTEEDIMSGEEEGYYFRYGGLVYRIIPQYVMNNVLYWSRFEDDGKTTLFKLYVR